MSRTRLIIGSLLIAATAPRVSIAVTRADSVQILDADDQVIAYLPTFSIGDSASMIDTTSSRAIDNPVGMFEHDGHIFALEITKSGFMPLLANYNSYVPTVGWAGDELFYASSDCSGTPHRINANWPGLDSLLIETALLGPPNWTVYVRSGAKVVMTALSMRRGTSACKPSSWAISDTYDVMTPIADMRDYYRPPFRLAIGCQRQCGSPLAVIGPRARVLGAEGSLTARDSDH